MRTRSFVVAVLATMIGGSNVNAGMGLNANDWAELKRDAYFVGTFSDWRGLRASFFVDAKSNELIGPFDHQVPSEPGDGAPAPTANPAPTVAPGTRGMLTFLGAVPTKRFGKPLPQAKLLGSPMASDPESDVNGSFIAFLPSAETITMVALIARVNDPLMLGMFGPSVKAQIWALSDGTQQRRALRGLLLGGHAALARAFVHERLWNAPRTAQNDVLPAFGLLMDGLPGMLMAPPCDTSDVNRCHALYPLIPIARAWLAGNTVEATRLANAMLKLPCCYIMPAGTYPGPMESTPNEPILGPFERHNVFAQGSQMLNVRAPEFARFLINAAHEAQRAR